MHDLIRKVFNPRVKPEGRLFSSLTPMQAHEKEEKAPMEHIAVRG
jgi:hypothetical protein